jgi:hyperosmotically inducible protein
MVLGVAAIAVSMVAWPLSIQAADSTADKAESNTERFVDKANEKAESKTEELIDKTTEKAHGAKDAVKDSWLTAKTKIALAADKRVKASHVDVDTRDAKVTLRGTVDSEEAKTAAEEVTRGIEGVTAVQNDLQVVAPAHRETVRLDDKNLSRQVKKMVSKDPSLKKAAIDIETNAGVVTLKGEVPTLTASAHASELARQVPGVRAVKNDLSIRENR